MSNSREKEKKRKKKERMCVCVCVCVRVKPRNQPNLGLTALKTSQTPNTIQGLLFLSLTSVLNSQTSKTIEYFCFENIFWFGKKSFQCYVVIDAERKRAS